jgi:hypothetical protein
MFYRNKDNNQHISIIKKHDPIHIHNSNIYTISHAYGKLSTHPTQKRTELESRYRKKSYKYPAARISGLSKYERKHTKKQLEKNLQHI